MTNVFDEQVELAVDDRLILGRPVHRRAEQPELRQGDRLLRAARLRAVGDRPLPGRARHAVGLLGGDSGLRPTSSPPRTSTASSRRPRPG